MANQLLSTFNAGELSPYLDSRIEIDKYRSGCKTLENFIVTPYGGVYRRPGTEFLGEAKYADKLCAVIDFDYSVTTRFVLELGEEYCRFWSNGARVEDPGSPGDPLEIATLYQEADLRDVQYVQINDVMYFAHPSYPPQKLTRTADDAWAWEEIVPAWPALLEQNLDETFTLTPDGNTGTIALVANKNIFTAQHVGAVFQIAYPRATPFVEKAFDANGSSVQIKAIGAWEINTSGTWGGRLSIERSYDGGSTWNVIRFYAVNSDRNIATGGNEARQCDLRLTFSDRTAGSSTDKATLSISDPFDYGIVKITAVSDAQNATATVLNDLTPFAAAVSAISVTNAGAGYTTAPTVSITGGGGSGATATATINHSVTGLSLTNGGTGYDLTTTVSLTGGGGSGATASVSGLNVMTGAISGISITNGGTGYTSAPTVSFSGPGIQAAATASISGGVVSITVTNGGAGYIATPTVSLSGGAGSGATATATTTNPDRETYYWTQGAWSPAQGYPRSVELHDGRIFWGATRLKPLTIWGSAIDDFENFRSSAIADAGVSISIAAAEASAIQWLASKGGDLLVGTARIEGSIGSGSPEAAISADSIQWTRHTAYGSAHMQPLDVGDTLIFLQRSSRRLRELFYNDGIKNYTAPDVTLFAEHVTTGGILEIASQTSNEGIVWAIRADGTLLGMSYERDQGLQAWHRHTTQGDFESVCVIPGETDDEVWFSVKRTIDGVEKRFIERFRPGWREAFEDEAKPDWWYVDCGKRIENGPASATVAGLAHLEGESAAMLADGAVETARTVDGGEVTASFPCSVAIVGLPYISTLLPMTLRMNGTIGHTARIASLKARVLKSMGGEYSTDGVTWNRIPSRSTQDAMDDSPPVFTGETDDLADRGNHSTDPQIWIRQRDPAPLTVLALIPQWNAAPKP